MSIFISDKNINIIFISYFILLQFERNIIFPFDSLKNDISKRQFSHSEDSRFSSPATGNSRVCTRRFAFIRAVGRGAKRQMFSRSGWRRVELLWGERANALPFLPLVSRFQWFQLTSSFPSWQQRAPCPTALPLFAAFNAPGLYSWRETLSNTRVSYYTRIFASNYVMWNQSRWMLINCDFWMTFWKIGIGEFLCLGELKDRWQLMIFDQHNFITIIIITIM